jgi:pSer/pThr/pTyr-binding forkhead associated (FHA) protein
MSKQIVLTVITGPHRNQQFIFDHRLRCLAGRSDDCLVRLCGEARDMQISRHHCLLDVDPPYVWVSDLGSRNGTYINGKRVEACACPGHSTASRHECLRSMLQNGDVLTLGGSSFAVSISGEGGEEWN